LSLGAKGPHHVYAGSYDGTLFETQTQSLLAVSRFLKSTSVRGMAAGLDIQGSISVRQILQSTEAALFAWTSIDVVDKQGTSIDTGNIRQVAVVSGLRPPKIALATDRGVFWSDIPEDGRPYSFLAATGIHQTSCLSLALGTNDSVVTSPQGDLATSSANGIYRGDWHSGTLEMRRSQHHGDIDLMQWKRAVIASSAGDRSSLYAAVEASGRETMSLRQAAAKVGISGSALAVRQLAQRLAVTPALSLSVLIEKVIPPRSAQSVYAVLISSDGGSTWAPCGPNGKVSESIELLGDTGLSMDAYNMCIAVSPVDTNIVALGWRNGPWIGTNGPTAFTWEGHGEENSKVGPTGHLHADVHGLHFDSHDPQGRAIYVCSDGGVAFSRDLGKSFDSTINAGLANLQFQSLPRRLTARIDEYSNGEAGASLITSGLVAGLLQDNGVVFSSVVDGKQQPWKPHSRDEDGQTAIILKNNLLLYWTNSADAEGFSAPRVSVAKWVPSSFEDPLFVTVRTASPTVPKGSFLFKPFVEPVFHPAFEMPFAKQHMFAIAANGSQGPNELWGLFADADGSNPFWDFLTSIHLEPDDHISAVGSDTGLTVFIGTNRGNISALDVLSGVITVVDSFTEPNTTILQFGVLSNGAAIVRSTGGSLSLFDPVRRIAEPIIPNGLPIQTEGGELYFIAIDDLTTPNTIYAATDFGIHASWDIGANWLPVSQGLPVRAHPSVLRSVPEGSDSHLLYLFTYGRSAWRARLLPRT
jgi:hypothetical protein